VFIAGLWKPAGEGSEICCAILAEPVSPGFAFIRDRQPDVLDSESRRQLLDPELSAQETIRRVARRLNPDQIMAYPVSTRMNRSANDDPGPTEPEADAGGNQRDL